MSVLIRRTCSSSVTEWRRDGGADVETTLQELVEMDSQTDKARQ